MPRRVKEKPEDFKKRMQQSGEAKEKAKDNMYLTGGQAKLDKNKNNRLDAQDFKILRAEKAKGRGMGLQDEKVKPGKVMKAKKGMSFSQKMKMVEEGKIDKKTGKFTSMEAMREAKGFKPGESAKDFNKRRMELARAKDAAKALGSRGKIALGIAAAGVGAIQYLKSKMKKKKESKDTVKDGSKVAASKLSQRMGGGMMKRYNKGGGADTGTAGERRSKLATSIDALKRRVKKKKLEAPKRPPMQPAKAMGGGMMKRYQTGGMTDEQKQKVKLGLGTADEKDNFRPIKPKKSEKRNQAKRLKVGGPASFTEQQRRAGRAPGSLGADTIEKRKRMRGLPSMRGAKRKETLGEAQYQTFRKELDTKFSKTQRLQKSYKGASPTIKADMEKRFKDDFNPGEMVKSTRRDATKTFFKSGGTVTAKCKLGRNKPTKIY